MLPLEEAPRRTPSLSAESETSFIVSDQLQSYKSIYENKDLKYLMITYKFGDIIGDTLLFPADTSSLQLYNISTD